MNSKSCVEARENETRSDKLRKLICRKRLALQIVGMKDLEVVLMSETKRKFKIIVSLVKETAHIVEAETSEEARQQAIIEHHDKEGVSLGERIKTDVGQIG